jgi:hypothetical protein
MAKLKIPEKVLRAEYSALVSDPWRWIHSSQALFSTAQSLEPRIHSFWRSLSDHFSFNKTPMPRDTNQAIEHQSVYLTLMAYSLENLLKAHLVERDRSSIAAEVLRTGALPRPLKTHDLVALAADCGLSLNDSEAALIRRLTRHAKWIDRYPFATSVHENYNLTIPSVSSGETGWSSKHVGMIKQLITSISARLGKTVQRKAAG